LNRGIPITSRLPAGYNPGHFPIQRIGFRWVQARVTDLSGLYRLPGILRERLEEREYCSIS
jgi:hypothetical protein